MHDRADVVVVGSGPNALIAAAYLARGGLSVTVLEAQEVAGGGTMTAELTLPGYRHDFASSFHPLVQFNPLIAADELGLISDHGLRYVAPDPVTAMQSVDGETLASRRNVEDTAAEIFRYSEADAEAFRSVVEEWEVVLPAFVRRLSGPPGTVPDRSPELAARLGELMAASAASMVNERFEDERTRALLLAPVAHEPVNLPGTGFLPMHWAGMLSRVGWPHPVEGSSSLARALIASIESHEGKVVCGQVVERIVVEQGRAVGVMTAAGERFDADRAVVSSAYVTRLPHMLGDERLPREFDKLKQWRHGPAIFVIHLALDRVPRYRTAAGSEPIALGAFGTANGYAAQREDVAAGRLSGPDRWMMTLCPSVVDSSRAPEGHATWKLLTFVPYALEGDPANWERQSERYADQLLEDFAKTVDDYEPGDELARTVHSPLDFERINPNFVAGGFQGGELAPDQAGPNRPVAGWAAYRMPVPGLYLTGASTFPGGGVSGWPGRNAARAVLDDLGIDAGEFMREAGEVDTLPPADLSVIPVTV